MNRDQVVGMFLGVAIGDALGMPVETMTAAEIAAKYGRVTKYIQPTGHKWYDGWEAGRWTDDTQLTLAVTESLIAKGEIDVDDIARRSISAMKECSVGWGKSTKESLERINTGVSRIEAGNPKGSGNGVAMKVAPLAAYLVSIEGCDAYIQARKIIEFTIMTHKSDLAVESAFIQILALAHCLYGKNYHKLIEGLLPLTKRIKSLVKSLGYKVESLDQDLAWRIKGIPSQTKIFSRLTLERKAVCYDGATCFVYNSLPFSLAMFLNNTHSIKTLYDTVSAGGDTDTNGSIVASLLGALNGTEIFSQQLIDGLWQKDKILQVANDFCDRFKIK